jgi:nucleoside-diphosphate-sugar epimerase
MKLTIFGTSGGVGRHVVTQAVDRGHQVVAYVRIVPCVHLTVYAVAARVGAVSLRGVWPAVPEDAGQPHRDTVPALLQ